jgi:hypothetical protein
MRGFNKFLFKNKWHVYCFFFKKRILKFKRPKWKKIQFRIISTLRYYKRYKIKIIALILCKFLKNLQFLKKKILIHFKYNFFLKKLKSFLVSRHFKKIKRNLISKLQFPFQNLKFFLKKKYFFNKNFKNFFFIFNFINLSHFIVRSRFFFKNLLFMKSTVLKYFNGCFSVKFFKKLSLSSVYKENLISFFIKPEFRLDMLLWRLNFFISPYLARFAFQKNLVLINNNSILNYYFLKQHYTRCLNGIELISLNLKYSFKHNLNSFVKFLYLSTFLEVDYYSGNIILIKNLNNLTFKDINSMLKEPLCFYKFKNYIFK